MDTQQQGTATAAAQTGTTGEQAATQQTQATQAATETAATITQAQTSPSVEELQRQLADQTEKLRLTNESARHWQSQADKERLRVQALAGTQTQVDPVAEKAKQYAKQFNLNEEDTRNILGILQSEIQPITQRNQQLEAAFTGTSQVPQVMQSLQSDPVYGRFLADPDVLNGLYQSLQEVAMQGQTKFVNAEYGREVIKGLAFEKFVLAQNGAQAQQTTAQPLRAFLGFNGNLQPGYTPIAAQPKASDPTVDLLAQKMAQHMGHKL
jgi:hypothetical protein